MDDGISKYVERKRQKIEIQSKMQYKKMVMFLVEQFVIITLLVEM